MKDKEARELITMTIDMITQLRVNAERDRELILKEVSIKDCPECKYPVLAQKISDGCSYSNAGYHPSVLQCLSCGTKFTCREKCEVIDAVK